MSGLDYFAWIVLITMIIAVVSIWVILAMLPGKIARQRQHPQADAINVSGWLGALAFGVFWPIALIWAFTNPTGANRNFDTGATLKEVNSLQARIEDIEVNLAASEERLS